MTQIPYSPLADPFYKRYEVLPGQIRKDVVFASAPVAANINAQGSARLGITSLITALTLAHPGRVRGYRTQAAATADLARAPGGAISAALESSLVFDAVFEAGTTTLPRATGCALDASGLLFFTVSHSNVGNFAPNFTLSALVLEGI